MLLGARELHPYFHLCDGGGYVNLESEGEERRFSLLSKGDLMNHLMTGLS